VPDRAGRYARTWLHLDLQGVYLDVAHRQSVTMVNTAMPLEREGRYALIRSQSEAQAPPDLIIRAHTHHYRWVDVDGQPLALACPAWKMPSAYEETRITPNRVRSSTLGSVLLHVDPERKTRTSRWPGEYIRHEFVWYAMPKVGVTKYEPT